MPGNNEEMAIVYGIIEKWRKFTERWGGRFVRYMDGDPNNGAQSNVICVSPVDTFAHIHDTSWTVNWPQPLSADETEFVLKNSSKFNSIFGSGL